MLVTISPRVKTARPTQIGRSPRSSAARTTRPDAGYGPNAMNRSHRLPSPSGKVLMSSQTNAPRGPAFVRDWPLESRGSAPLVIDASGDPQEATDSQLPMEARMTIRFPG